MTDTMTNTQVAEAIRQAEALEAGGDARAAIELLTRANRTARRSTIEIELVRLRREEGARQLLQPRAGEPEPIPTLPPTGLAEVEAADLTVEALRDGLARSGCLLVRGLVTEERAAELAAGIDASIAAYDASIDGDLPVDAAWYDPRPMPDRAASGMPEPAHRAFLRGRGGFWTADSPRMLFELFELIEQTSLGPLLTEFLGQRPLMSGIKGTLRRVPPDVEVDGRWHQDGSFLGEQIGAMNIWLALTRCGRDAPGLDIVPRRIDHVVSDPAARYDWSLSDEAVLEAAGDAGILRPLFEPGDALLFDHLLVHRTGASPGMTRTRHAIESWFFAPAAYPAGQLPILY